MAGLEKLPDLQNLVNAVKNGMGEHDIEEKLPKLKEQLQSLPLDQRQGILKVIEDLLGTKSVAGGRRSKRSKSKRRK